MKVIYKSVLDEIKERAREAAKRNRTIRKIIVTPEEFEELKKEVSNPYRIMIAPPMRLSDCCIPCCSKACEPEEFKVMDISVEVEHCCASCRRY